MNRLSKFRESLVDHAYEAYTFDNGPFVTLTCGSCVVPFTAAAASRRPRVAAFVVILAQPAPRPLVPLSFYTFVGWARTHVIIRELLALL